MSHHAQSACRLCPELSSSSHVLEFPFIFTSFSTITANDMILCSCQTFTSVSFISSTNIPSDLVIVITSPTSQFLSPFFLFNLLFCSVHIPYSNVLHTCAKRLSYLLGICNHPQSVNDSDKYHISFTFYLYFQPVTKSTDLEVPASFLWVSGTAFAACLIEGVSTMIQLNQPGKRQGTRLYSLFMPIFKFFWS